MAGGDVVSLCFPPLPETDHLYAKKMTLLRSRNIGLEVEAYTLSTADLLQTLDQLIQTARILQLIEAELYFMEDDEFGPFTPRNELESLNSILSLINSSLLCVEGNKAKVLRMLRERTVDMISSTVIDSAEKMTVEVCDSHAEELLLEWGLNHGVRTKLKISYFKGAGRGAVASEDMNVGDTALEIPESFIITEDVLLQSEMFNILKRKNGISVETMLLLWSMKERYNSNSMFKIYFETLPDEFNTGLSFGFDALIALQGTLLLEEILQAREHLRKQYDALCPVLCTDYPEVFELEWYTWANFLWACELWYSNSMKVVFSDGKLKTCLVPVAGLLNHSLHPHILHYGMVDQVTKTLKFNLSRPCKGGEQCYLSYGNYPSSHLITFYGFMPEGDNPYDVIPLDFDTPHDGSGQLPDETGWTTHMVRGTWLSNKSNLYPCYGLPSPLLTHLRAILKDSDTVPPSEVPGQVDCYEDYDKVMFETIQSIFVPMMEGLGESDEHYRENSGWDVKLALEYKDLQRRIVSSVLSSCHEGLKLLGCP